MKDKFFLKLSLENEYVQLNLSVFQNGFSTVNFFDRKTKLNKLNFF